MYREYSGSEISHWTMSVQRTRFRQGQEAKGYSIIVMEHGKTPTKRRAKRLKYQVDKRAKHTHNNNNNNGKQSAKPSKAIRLLPPIGLATVAETATKKEQKHNKKQKNKIK